MYDIGPLQTAISDSGCAGWLMYDFRGINPLARNVLELNERPVGSRRWFYFVPASGTPTRLVHAIETDALDSLPGEKTVYRSWRSLHESIRQMLPASGQIAMEYSPLANNPYVSRVDAGTIELVKQCGVEVVSSGDLAQRFDSCLSDEQWQEHLRSDAVTTSAFGVAWKFIGDQIAAHGKVSELDVCEVILKQFAAHHMTTYSPPIIARQPYNRLPHYETGTGDDTAIRAGDLVLIDMWCKGTTPAAIYSDLTKMAYVGSDLPAEYATVFGVVAAARDAGIEFVKSRFATGDPPQGWEVDAAVRAVIEKAGYGDAFIHRTGHSLGAEVHGNGAHLDDLEMHEDRRILPRSLFTIEPGIYLDTFGVRSEVDLYVDEKMKVHVTGEPVQSEIELI